MHFCSVRQVLRPAHSITFQKAHLQSIAVMQSDDARFPIGKKRNYDQSAVFTTVDRSNVLACNCFDDLWYGLTMANDKGRFVRQSGLPDLFNQVIESVLRNYNGLYSRFQC